jgi:hypothetical protein
VNNNFNNSVATIFNKLKECGYTPTNTSLSSITAAITNMYNGRYKAGQDNVKGATLTTSNFNGAVSNGKYNITSTSAGYVPSGKTIHSLTARSINATIGVNGTYTIPSGYHDGTGKVKFSATPGTATATATAAPGNVTVNLGATGYYNKVTINQTATYNAGINAALVNLGTGQSFNVSNYSGYKNFTVDNFILYPVAIAEWQHGSDHMSGDWHFGSGGSLTLTKSYNNSTGILTAYVTMTTFKTINGSPSERESRNFNVGCYLWVK